MGALLDVPGLNVYIISSSIIIFCLIFIFCTKKEDRKRERIIYIILINTVGISGFGSIISGIIHLSASSQIAKSIGWPESPFQMEVAFSNLAIGFIGYPVFWMYDFILPAIIARTTFLWGAGITHIVEYVKNDNHSPNNVGATLFWDFLNPIICITLYILHRMYQYEPPRKTQKSDKQQMDNAVNPGPEDHNLL
eukprot:UN01978